MLMNNLSIIVRHSKVFCDRRLQDLGVGFPEQVILMFLSAKKGVNQDAIAQHFMLDKGAIAKTVKKLEEKGLIERRIDKDNKKRVEIYILDSADDIIKDGIRVQKQLVEHQPLQILL